MLSGKVVYSDKANQDVYCYPHDRGMQEVRSRMMESNNTDFTAAPNWLNNEVAQWVRPTRLQQTWLDESYRLTNNQ